MRTSDFFRPGTSGEFMAKLLCQHGSLSHDALHSLMLEGGFTPASIKTTLRRYIDAGLLRFFDGKVAIDEPARKRLRQATEHYVGQVAGPREIPAFTTRTRSLPTESPRGEPIRRVSFKSVG